jgi:uncharacterized protein (DUF1330 family)
MTAYWIGQARMRDPDGYRHYAELAKPAFAAHEHKVLARGGSIETLEGRKSYDRFVVLEFPSKQAALDCYWSEAYQRAAVVRQHASEDCQLVIVDGV